MSGLRDGSAVGLCRVRAPRLLVCALLALVLAVPPTESVGAMCNTAISPAQWREMSSVVFQGRVVEAYGEGGDLAPKTGARMQVQRVWKGDLHGYVDVSAGPPNLVEPARFFLPGVEYLVYAQGQAPTVTILTCSPMSPISQARDEVLFLSYGIPIHWTGRLVVIVAVMAALCLLLDATSRFGRRARGMLMA